MYILPKQSSTVSILWVGGEMMLAHLWCLHPPQKFYSLQTAMGPGNKQISVVSPSPCYDFQFFSEHPYYLPWWLDGFYSLLNFSSPPLEPYLEIVQTSVQANVPNNESTKDAKEPIKGSRHSQTSSKAANCDIEGITCKEPQTLIGLGATHPTRCTGHKMPDMV